MGDEIDPGRVVERVIECDNGRDKAGYRALLHDDYHAYVHGKLGATEADSEADALAAWWAANSDVHLEPLQMIVQGELVSLRYRLRGTNDGEFFGRPASGRSFEVENCTLFEILDGRVKQVWRYSDTLGLMTQLGFGSGE